MIPTNAISANKENQTDFYAIISACIKYENKSLNLPLSMIPSPIENDFFYLFDALNQSTNWKRENIILLINENATKQNLTNAFQKMSNLVDSNDIFLFSWAGHGSIMNDTDGDEKKYNPTDFYDEIICPYDINVINSSLVNALSDDELEYYFSNINAKGKCLLFESCFSGGLISENETNQSLFQHGLYTDIASSITETIDVDKKNNVVVMSTIPNHLSRLGVHGFSLTYSLAKAFENTNNDKNNDGFISIEEAFNNAKKRYVIESAAPFMLSWIYFYLSMKLGLHNLAFKIPFFKQFYEKPFVRNIYEFLYEKHPFLSTTGLIFISYTLMQLKTYLQNGFFVLNYPNMYDGYPQDLPIIQTT